MAGWLAVSSAFGLCRWRVTPLCTCSTCAKQTFGASRFSCSSVSCAVSLSVLLLSLAFAGWPAGLLAGASCCCCMLRSDAAIPRGYRCEFFLLASTTLTADAAAFFCFRLCVCVLYTVRSPPRRCSCQTTAGRTSWRGRRTGTFSPYRPSREHCTRAHTLLIHACTLPFHDGFRLPPLSTRAHTTHIRVPASPSPSVHLSPLTPVPPL